MSLNISTPLYRRLDLEKRTLQRDVIAKSNTIDVLSEIIKKYKTKYSNDYDIMECDIDENISDDIDKILENINI